MRASDTDSNIPWEFYRHYTFFNPDCPPRNKLLVHLVGTYGNPSSSLIFPGLAANNGFHVVSLKYNNDTSAQAVCGNSTDVNCHYNFRKEIIEGIDYSPDVAVDSVNSIYNRLIRLLQYMDTNYPGQGWGSFYSGNTINWSNILLSGHSQGGGHIAVISIDNSVERVLMFASPNDYSHAYSQLPDWTSLPSATPYSAYYSFNNINDQVAEYNWQYTSALNLGEGNFGDSINVDNKSCPYMFSHNLYTSIDSSGFTTNHGMVVSDNNIIMDSTGKPIFEDVWRYMLGIECLPLSTSEIVSNDLQPKVFPNPANDYVQVKTSALATPLSYRFITITGQDVTAKVHEMSGVAFDISGLSPGTYFVQFTDLNGNCSVQKLIIRH